MFVKNERMINHTKEYLLSNNTWVDLRALKQYIKQGIVVNATILLNGKVRWAINPQDTDENKFYTYLLMQISRGSFLQVPLELHKAYMLSSTGTDFRSNLESLLKMFVSYLIDTDYTFMKVKFHKALKDDYKSSDLLNYLDNDVLFKELYCNFRYTLLGENLYYIWVLDLSRLLASHTNELFGDLRLNNQIRVEKLTFYLSNSANQYNEFCVSLQRNKHALESFTRENGAELESRLSVLSNVSQSTSYEDIISQNINAYDSLYSLFTSSVKGYQEKSFKFIHITNQCLHGAKNIVDNEVVKIGYESINFFDTLCSNYAKTKLPKSVYSLMKNIDACLTEADINIILFSHSYARFINKKKFDTTIYTVPYLSIGFDVVTKDTYKLARFYDSSRSTSPHVKSYFILGWLCAYRLLFTGVDLSKLLKSSDYDSLFFKLFEDTLIYSLKKNSVLSISYDNFKADITDTFMKLCTKYYNTNFKHSDFITNTALMALLK